MSDISGLARLAYDHGQDPLDYAEEQVGILITVHLMVAAARIADPGSFPGYIPNLTIAALARRILGDLLDAGWTAPERGGTP